MNRLLYSSVFLFLLPGILNAGAFVQKGFSARSSALGNSYTALSNDPAGLFFNPAGLGEITGMQAQTTYARLFPDVQDDNLNLFTGGVVVNYPTLGTFGVGGSFFNSQNWKESEFAAGYGLTLWNAGQTSFAIGGTFRLLHWSAAPPPDEAALSYNGFTVNAGVLYAIKNFLVDTQEPSVNSVRLGLHFENLTQPSVSASGSKDARLPLNIEGGVAYVSGAYDYLISTTVAYSESRLRYKLGAEFVVAKGEFIGSTASVVARIGGDRDAHENSQGEYSGGFGLVWNSIGIDYVYHYAVELLDAGGTQRISIVYNF